LVIEDADKISRRRRLNPDELKIGSGAEAGVFEMGHYDSRFDSLKSSNFDPRALWERVDGDAELLRELVELFLKECPGLLRNIAAAIEQRSFDDVRHLSHKLKGSALQLSGSGVAALAGSLEQMGEKKSLQGADRVFSDLQQKAAALAQSLQSLAGRKGSIE
jgi:HPt (histidine-containing phosphotransfer) domain-containing protein